MPCVICFDDDDNPKLTLICNHSFCHGCVKDWYTKGGAGAGCPLCRRALHFRGLYKIRDKWNQETDHNKFQAVYGRVLDDLLEYHPHPLFAMCLVERNMEKFWEWAPDMDEEELEWNLENFVDVGIETFTVNDECATYVALLLVPKRKLLRTSRQFAGLDQHWVSLGHLPIRTHIL
jgi:hypothetical protein